jgi:hypothetical protein
MRALAVTVVFLLGGENPAMCRTDHSASVLRGSRSVSLAARLDTLHHGVGPRCCIYQSRCLT